MGSETWMKYKECNQKIFLDQWLLFSTDVDEIQGRQPEDISGPVVAVFNRLSHIILHEDHKAVVTRMCKDFRIFCNFND